MIKFRASGLLAAYFFFQAFYQAQGHQWLNFTFTLILALCLLACYLAKPLKIGNLIEFGGW